MNFIRQRPAAATFWKGCFWGYQRLVERLGGQPPVKLHRRGEIGMSQDPMNCSGRDVAEVEVHCSRGAAPLIAGEGKSVCTGCLL